MLCGVSDNGHPEMYGLGLRLAFYLQWLGLTVIEYMDESALAPVRLIGLALSTSAFLGLLLQAPAGNLSPAEAYLVFLLAASTYIYVIPIYIWKTVTRFDSHWDPFQCTAEQPSPIFKVLDFILMLALSCVGVWYWCAYVTDGRLTCAAYGFFFSPVLIKNKAFIAFNALIWLTVLLASVATLLLRARQELDIFSERKKSSRRAK